MRIFKPHACVALLVLASCSTEAPAPQIDLANERTALMDTDLAWSATVPDLDKFLSFFADDASFLPPDMPLAQGQEAIRATAAQILSTPGFSINWKATKADVSGTADLGYTMGVYQATMNDAAGKPMASVGKYVTVWKKQADGQWKVVADCFNADGPPMPAAQ
jgi:ketosteroid isomerase-like protein